MKTVLSCAVLWLVLGAGVMAPLASAGEPRAQAGALQSTPLPYTFHDNLGTQWDVMPDAIIGPGQADIYDAGGRLFVGEGQPYNTGGKPAQLDAARNELILPAQPLGGLTVSRRIAVNGKESWCRFTEILENTTNAPVKTQVRLSFEMGQPIQSADPVPDPVKTDVTIGMTVFDGNHGIAMLGAGRKAKTAPAYGQPQPNGNGNVIDARYDVEVPARRSVVIVHFQAVRNTPADAEAFLRRADDRSLLQDLPPDLARRVVNFASHSSALGDLDLLRGDLLDVVELRGGDRYKGTLKEARYALQTPYGRIELPAERVAAMLTVGEYRPIQLMVTRDGEAFGGVLQSPVISLQLSSGQVTPIPLTSIARLGYRRAPGETEEWTYEQPVLQLRTGDRIGVRMPAAPIPVATRYGHLLLKPGSIASIAFQAEEQAVHEIILTDGSRFAGLVESDPLALTLRTVGDGKPVNFLAATVSRLQLSPKASEPDKQTPTLTLTNSDRFVGVFDGKLTLETAFDAIELDGAGLRAVRHGNSAPAEVQVTLWDGATLSGRLRGDEVRCALGSGAIVKVPVAMIDRYEHPQPMPPAPVLDKIKCLVSALGAEDWKEADRASAELVQMGAPIAGALRSLRGTQNQQSQQRIDKILETLAAADSVNESKGAPTSAPADPAPANDPDLDKG